jgi:hypothetical protein
LKTSISDFKNAKINTVRHNTIADEKATETAGIDELIFCPDYLINRIATNQAVPELCHPGLFVQF